MMKKLLTPIPVAILYLAGSTLPLAAETAYDSRRIVCAQPCTLRLQAGNGTIEVKIPTASATLKTLYQPGDTFELEGNKDYVLRFNESQDGFFSFDLQFAPRQGGSTWSCRVRTVAEPPFEVEGPVARHPQKLTDDDFFQAGELYRRVMNDTDREHLVGNIVAHLGKAQRRIQLRQAALFFKADPDYGRRVAAGLGVDLKEVKRLAAMSQAKRVQATAK